MQMCFIFLVFVHYQSLHQNRAHMCNILATFFDILEINISDEDSDQNRNVRRKKMKLSYIISGPSSQSKNQPLLILLRVDKSQLFMI